jgi:hypothetical protein
LSDFVTGPVSLEPDHIDNGIAIDYVAWPMLGTIVLGGVVKIG